MEAFEVWQKKAKNFDLSIWHSAVNGHIHLEEELMRKDMNCGVAVEVLMSLSSGHVFIFYLKVY